MQVYKWGFVSRPSGQMVWKTFSYHMFQRGNRQLCRQMKRGEKSRSFPHHPRPTLQSEGEKHRFCGAAGASSSINSSSNSTANRTITSAGGIGINSCCSSSSSIDMKSAHIYASEFRAAFENTPHFDVLVRSLYDHSANSFDINDLNELLCVLEDLE